MCDALTASDLSTPNGHNLTWLDSPPQQGLVAERTERVVKAAQPHTGWMVQFILIMRLDSSPALRKLPNELYHIIIEFGAEKWIVDHPGMVGRAASVDVISSTRVAFPARWSKGVTIPDTGTLSLDVRISQESLPKGDTLDDRYMVGLVKPELFLPNDYPLQVLGQIVAVELSGRVVYSEEHCEDICDLNIYQSADVELRISKEARSVEVFIDGLCRGTSKV